MENDEDSWERMLNVDMGATEGAIELALEEILVEEMKCALAENDQIMKYRIERFRESQLNFLERKMNNIQNFYKQANPERNLVQYLKEQKEKWHKRIDEDIDQHTSKIERSANDNKANLCHSIKEKEERIQVMRKRMIVAELEKAKQLKLEYDAHMKHGPFAGRFMEGTIINVSNAFVTKVITIPQFKDHPGMFNKTFV